MRTHIPVMERIYTVLGFPPIVIVHFNLDDSLLDDDLLLVTAFFERRLREVQFPVRVPLPSRPLRVGWRGMSVDGSECELDLFLLLNFLSDCEEL